MAIENTRENDALVALDGVLVDHLKENVWNIDNTRTEIGQVEGPANNSGESSSSPPQEAERNRSLSTVTSCFDSVAAQPSCSGSMSTKNAILVQAADVSFHVVKFASLLSRQSGKDENIVTYLKEVIEYMKKTPGIASAHLQCVLFYRCAKVFHQLGCTEEALEACDFAQKLAAGLHPDMTTVELAIKILRVKIHRIHGNEMCTELNTELFNCFDALPFAECGMSQIGFIREIPLFELGGLSLVRIFAYYLVEETKYRNPPFLRAIISLTIFSYGILPFDEQRLRGHFAGIEEAIEYFQQAECECISSCVNCLAELFGEFDCPRHQLLSDALFHLGRHQYMLGFMEAAEENYQQSLKLAQQCKDNDRQMMLHCGLFEFYLDKVPTSSRFSNEIVENFLRVGRLEDLNHHRQEFTKFAQIPGPASGKRNLGIYFDKVDQAGSLEETMALEEQLVMKTKETGDIRNIVIAHAVFCNRSRVEGNVEGTKRHFLRALDYLQNHYSDEADWEDFGILMAIQNLGHATNMPELEVLEELGQYAFGLWKRVYDHTQQVLEALAKAGEEAALQYFETIKHASNQIAKHFALRGDSIGARNNIIRCGVEWVQTHPQEFEEIMDMVRKSLIWAERGKGRMLMSFIGAVRKNPQGSRGGDHLRLLERLNLPRDYPDNFESRFSRDDSFARQFIQQRSKYSPTMVFVEYTFIDHVRLLTHVTDGSKTVSFNLMDLSQAIHKDIRHDAEDELDRLDKILQKQSSSNTEVGSQSLPELVVAESSVAKESSPGDADASTKVLSAMNKYGINRLPFNRWIPGIVACIQRRVAEAQSKRKKNRSFHKEEEKIRELLQTLYSVLIEPFEEYILSKKFNCQQTVVFVPHEDLGVVPFAALHKTDDSECLIEQCVISVSPAIWCSRHCEYLYEKQVDCDPVKGKEIVLVGRKSGYPTTPVEWQNLEMAYDEVNAVAEALWPTLACKKVFDDTPEMKTCMKELVTKILPDASWIHLSVHGEISPQFPQGSLLFGDNEKQRLTATEIITSSTSSPWSARCIVASACQSGLGSVAGGGIMGFARSFLLAGIPSCVLSMWEVNEAFCKHFMERFYGELKSGVTVGDAIKNTVKTMKEEKRKLKSSRRFSVEKWEPMWSILDWASFSCFGFPGVKLPTDATENVVRDSRAMPFSLESLEHGVQLIFPVSTGELLSTVMRADMLPNIDEECSKVLESILQFTDESERLKSYSLGDNSPIRARPTPAPAPVGSSGNKVDWGIHAGPVQHPRVECDECAMCPIIGTRYISIKKHDYDLCQKCFQENGCAIEDYTKLDKPVWCPYVYKERA